MSGPDRHLPATERKIKKAREEGQVARSRDLGHFAALAAGVLLLVAGAPWVIDQVLAIFASGLRLDARALAAPEAMGDRLALLAWPTLLVVGVIGGSLAASAGAAGVLAGGWNFSLKAIEPRWSKLDPLQGLTRIVSIDQLGTMLKACLLAVVLAIVGAIFLATRWDALQSLLAMPLPAAMSASASLVGQGLAMLLLPLAVFALVDVPLQRTLLLRRLRMSHEELKKEHKDVEGNVTVKAKMRARMREIVNRRMIAAVPGADLVVMNPTHYAVALKYDEASMGAPRVVAKGLDLIALRIRDVAREAGVPVLQAPPLARALYAHTELDQEIPARLFAAVAQVLAWVFQLRHAAPEARARLLDAPPHPEVPGDMDPVAQAPADAATKEDDA